MKKKKKEGIDLTLNLAEDFDKKMVEPLTEAEKKDLALMKKAHNEDGSFNSKLYIKLLREEAKKSDK